MNVRKTNNTIEEFDISKINKSISYAFDAINEHCPDGLRITIIWKLKQIAPTMKLVGIIC